MTKTGASGQVAYFYDLSGHIIGTYDQSGAATEEIVWFGDLPVASLQGGAAYFIMPDHLGAPHEIVNAANARVWFWDHDPFGNGTPTAAAGFSHDLRFPGQIYDAETRLHNNGFRDYSPTLGRYVQSDPIGLAGGINTYAYAGNNPLNLIDSLGLDPESKEKPEPLPDIDVAGKQQRKFSIFKGTPPGAMMCSACGVTFLAPSSFDLSGIVAAGRVGGFSLSAVNSAVGHYGAFDFQRSRDGSGRTTFYTEYQMVSNVAVGAYMYGTGYPEIIANAFEDLFAAFKSSNPGAGNQIIGQEIGWSAASGSCSISCGGAR